MPTEATMRVGYVLAEFPSATETFVADEIRGLMRCGASVTVFALREGRGEDAPPCPVHYRGEARHLDMRGFWKKYGKLAWDALKLEWRSPSLVPSAIRNVEAAFEFARLCRQENIGHLHAHFAFIPTDVALMIGAMEGLGVSFSAHAWDIYCAGRTLPTKVERADLCIVCTDAGRRHLSSLVEEPQRQKILRIQALTRPGGESSNI